MDNIKEMITNSCNKYSDNIAFYSKVNKEYLPITYKQMGNDINSLGTALNNMGLNGQKIAVIGRNSYEWSISYLSVVCGLGTIVPLDKQLTTSEIVNCVKQAGIKSIIYSPEMKKLLDVVAQEVDCNFISMDRDINKLLELGNKLLSNNDYSYVNKQINNKECNIMLFSSGTTSKSKIVMLNHSNIMHVVNNVGDFVNENDRLFSILPLHHALECTCGFLTPLSKGASIISCDNLKYITKDIKKMHPTIMISVPRILEMFDSMIAKQLKKLGIEDKSRIMGELTTIVDKLGFHSKQKVFKEIQDNFGGSLRLFIVGGAAMNPEISKRLRNYGFNVLQGYGLTECSPLVSVNREKKFEDDSVGLPISGTTISIDKPDEYGIGEIIINGPQVMMGYYNNEIETNKVLDKDGTFHTGDLGYKDKKGFIKITGRCKNMILTSNGENIYPEEIEDMLVKNDIIKECVVSENRVNDKSFLTAHIVLQDELLKRIQKYPQYKEEILESVKKIVDEQNKKVADYKRINNIDLREKEFEKTTTLKIKRMNIK